MWTTACDFFRLTETDGLRTGESFNQCPIEAGDQTRADQGYSKVPGLRHIVQAGELSTVRVYTEVLLLETAAAQLAILTKGIDVLAERYR